MDIPIRLGVAILIALTGIALYFTFNRLRLSLLRHAHSTRAVAELGLRSGVPAILYFTSTTCAPCRTIQGPAIEELRAEFGERLQIVKIDASEKLELADRWGVLTVPTTFLLDAKGHPRRINNGVMSASRLRRQLYDLLGLVELNSSINPSR